MIETQRAEATAKNFLSSSGLSHPIPPELWTGLQRRGLLPQVELQFP